MTFFEFCYCIYDKLKNFQISSKDTSPQAQAVDAHDDQTFSAF